MQPDNLQRDSLRPDTRRVLDWLAGRTEAKNFVLIGGTALALQAGHRQSEDLDLVYTAGPLDPRLIRTILDAAEAASFSIRDGADPTEIEELENEGHSPAYEHQDWYIGGVKTSFIMADATPSMQAATSGKRLPLANLAVADIEALFTSKARLLPWRHSARDLFDIWYFLSRRGKTIGDVLAEMRAVQRHVSDDLLLRFITDAKLSSRDPGFHPLLDGAPQTFEAVKQSLIEAVDAHVAAQAAEDLKSAPRL